MVKPEDRGFKSHPGQSFSLSLCGTNFISRANVHMVCMGRKLALHIALYGLICSTITITLQKRHPSLFLKKMYTCAQTESNWLE